MRYEHFINEDNVDSLHKIIHDFDAENEFKTDLINDKVLTAKPQTETVALLKVLEGLKALPEDTVGELIETTEQAIKQAQNQYVSDFMSAIKVDEIQDKKADRLEVDFSGWVKNGYEIGIPYQVFVKSALSFSTEEYKDYIVHDFLSNLQEGPTFSNSLGQVAKQSDLIEITEGIAKDGYYFYEMANGIKKIEQLIDKKYGNNEPLVSGFVNTISNAKLPVVFELAKQSDSLTLNNDMLDFTEHLNQINSKFEHTVNTSSPNMNKKAYGSSLLEDFNQLIEKGVFDSDISYFGMLNVKMADVKPTNNAKVNILSDIYHHLDNDALKENIQDAVNRREFNFISQKPSKKMKI